MRRFTLSFGLVLSLSACGGASCSGSDTKEPPGTVTKAALKASPLPFAADSKLQAALGRIHFDKAKADRNVSDGALLRERFLVVVTDEGLEFAVTDLAGTGSALVNLYGLISDTNRRMMGPEKPKEFDLEGVAITGDRVFLAASASIKVPKGDEEGAATIPASGLNSNYSNYVFELRDTATGTDMPTFEFVNAWDVRTHLLAEPSIAPYAKFTSKRNGIDVEGLAVADGRLWFALRGPVIAGRALVYSTALNGTAPSLRVLPLGGLGIRSLIPAPKGGFYLIAGPNSSADRPVALYQWDGSAASAENAGTPPTKLTDLPTDQESGHAEGLVVWNGALCVLFDGPTLGGAQCAPPGKF